MKKRLISTLFVGLSAAVPIASLVSCSKVEESKISIQNLDSNSLTINLDNIQLENKDKPITKEELQALYKFEIKKQSDADFKQVKPIISLPFPNNSRLSMTITGLEKETQYAVRIFKGERLVLLPKELQTFTTKKSPDISSISDDSIASDNTTLKFLYIELNKETFKNENNTNFALTYKQISDNGLPVNNSEEKTAQTKMPPQAEANTTATTARALLFKLTDLKPKSEYQITKIGRVNASDSSDKAAFEPLSYEKNILPYTFYTQAEIENVTLDSFGEINNTDGQTSEFKFLVTFGKNVDDFSKYKIFLKAFTTKDEEKNPTPEDQALFTALPDSLPASQSQDSKLKNKYIFKVTLPRHKVFRVTKATNEDKEVTISDAILEVKTDALQNK
ncbi:hypothetical protein [Mycoplasma sp. 1654_15]|uniref:hypothetical protein n=1 Tax=Mycoplasma sp. 1654_15 TaxID=2725994 RepID=UPI0014497C11|nr:hypothetical protein [Mycoplasma sp. 1654_15]QJB71342.1 hypothetical protein HF996_02525 [Mycoplasma sp. 1654_15]